MIGACVGSHAEPFVRERFFMDPSPSHGSIEVQGGLRVGWLAYLLHGCRCWYPHFFFLSRGNFCAAAGKKEVRFIDILLPFNFLFPYSVCLFLHYTAIHTFPLLSSYDCFLSLLLFEVEERERLFLDS